MENENKAIMDTQQAQINFSLENPNYPHFLAPVIAAVKVKIGEINKRLKNVKTNTTIESTYKDVIYNTAKLHAISLKDDEAKIFRYGTGGSHVWLSVLNNKNNWERVAVVMFENFC